MGAWRQPRRGDQRLRRPSRALGGFPTDAEKMLVVVQEQERTRPVGGEDCSLPTAAGRLFCIAPDEGSEGGGVGAVPALVVE